MCSVLVQLVDVCERKIEKFVHIYLKCRADVEAVLVTIFIQPTGSHDYFWAKSES